MKYHAKFLYRTFDQVQWCLIKFNDVFEIFARDGLTSFKRNVDITFLKKEKENWRKRMFDIFLRSLDFNWNQYEIEFLLIMVYCMPRKKGKEIVIPSRCSNVWWNLMMFDQVGWRIRDILWDSSLTMDRRLLNNLFLSAYFVVYGGIKNFEATQLISKYTWSED